jgi:hypothetical protein
MLCAGGGAAGGLSADDLRAALRSAEDEDDVAAAAVAEKEAEAEMDEFTAEPPPEGDKDDDLEGLEGDDGSSRMGKCSRKLFESSLLRLVVCRVRCIKLHGFAMSLGVAVHR